MSSPTRWPPKDTADITTVTFDFTGLATTISAPSVAVLVESSYAGDATPSAIKLGNAQVSGLQVLQQVTGGVDLTDYALRCTVTSNTGDKLTLVGVLPVRTLP